MMDCLSTAQSSSSSRALALLDAFAGPRSVLGVSELAAGADLPKSTAHRLLSILVKQNYVKRIGDRYALSEHAFEIGNLVAACRPGGLRETAVPFMVELAQQTHETVHLAVLHNGSVLYLEKLFQHYATPCPTAVGSRRPAHCTALGKALLAHSPDEAMDQVISGTLQRFTHRTIVNPDLLGRDLARARNDGVAVEIEEFRPGLVCVAVPIMHRRDNTPIGALSITSSVPRLKLRRFASLLNEASAALGSRLTSASL
ncbi:IclR family transcriptional regulator [Mycolicibacterium holsaticum]|uniref:IclR family transcriptional regulator n=2 Tax=Mycolicibacterium holsaticum TaxID=152142 RepID=UPI0030C69A8D